MPRSRPRLLALLTSISLSLAGLISVAAPANAADGDVRISEFSSNNPDFVELVNTGAGAVDLSGWVLKDSTENNSYTFPAGSSIAAGGLLALSGEGVTFAFGLGNGDAVRLFSDSHLSTPLDSYTYPAHPAAGKSYSRCPGSTDFVVVTASPGTANACATPDSAVRINERTSNNPDFVELVNTGAGAVDLSGWVLKDNGDNNSYTFPLGSSIAAGELLALSGEGVTFAFGLGNGDAVRLFSDSDLSTPLDSYTYPAHPAAGKSYGRCPSGSGDFEVTATATKGAANVCAPPAGAENIKSNEVQSDPADLVELTNIGETSVDISGYVLKDNDDTHVFAVPAGTSLAAHGYVVLDVNPSFGLGKGDSVRLYPPNQASLLDSTTYPANTHATNWGRCPDGTGDFGVVTDTLGAANGCTGAPSGPPDVVINEVESNGDQVADWVELKNRSAVPVSVSGWRILDNDPSHAATPVVIPAGTSIPAGGHYAIYTEISQSPGFGLGGADSVTLLLADGATQVDTTSWTVHATTTRGRCPDGTGDFRDTTASTRGLPNACSPIRINEVESADGTPGDWVELANISATSVDVSGYVVKDDDDAHAYTIPATTSIAAKGYLVLDESVLGFALDAADRVRLFGPDGTTLIEQHGWATTATQSYARCKDGLGDFKDSRVPTKGSTNSCPGLETAPWPGAQTVTTADLAGTFVQDLSGLVFDPADPDVLWAAQNKLGTLFKLTRDGDSFVPASGWPKNPTYVGGTGAPDTEGITIGPDGFVYLASERNNAASGVSRMSILRYDPSAAGPTFAATNEWNLTSQIPAAGANLGLEGVAFVPDSFLTSNGFKDQSTGALYSPATYPQHGTGLYFVAIEDTGDLIAFALDSDGTTSHKIATIDSGFEHLADVGFDPERQRVWAVTDDTHDGRTSLLKIDGTGAFVVDSAYDRPVGMPNLNNEGLAIAPQSRCVGGTKEVLWSDDGDTDGHSLRRGTISCTVPTPPAQPQVVTFTSQPPVTPVVGQTWTVTTQGGASGNPVTLAASGACTVTGTTVTFSDPGTCTVNAAQQGNASYEPGSAVRTITVTRAATTTSLTTGATAQRATVAPVAPGAGTPTGTVTFTANGTGIGSATLDGGVATLDQALPAGTTEVTATYVGDSDFTGSSGSADVVISDPTITAELSSPRPASGWWTGRVTVTFACTPGSAPITGTCPAPVTFDADGADQSVTRVITASDGGAATVRISNVDIDGTAPRVAVKGVRDGVTYRQGAVPRARCQAFDRLSGVGSCTLRRQVDMTAYGKRVVVTATALDVAGNEATDRLVYKIRSRRN
ncbi:lamin tail domain-containing protein [Nocardioides psychrotolerans]|uniref:lamin tail domain-containing protein n=1 Tax=Nocardioides psychrotolerans TaxID=1005945 RepID=UPI0031384279